MCFLFFPGCPLETLIRQVKPLRDADEIFSPYPTPATGPYFDLHRTVNVTALKGVTTHLVCRVKRLGNHTVKYVAAFVVAYVAVVVAYVAVVVVILVCGSEIIL